MTDHNGGWWDVRGPGVAFATVQTNRENCFEFRLSGSDHDPPQGTFLGVSRPLGALRKGARIVVTFTSAGHLDCPCVVRLRRMEKPQAWLDFTPPIAFPDQPTRRSVYLSVREDVSASDICFEFNALTGHMALTDIELHHAPPLSATPDRAYFICATPRSGSSWLASLLWNSKVAGRPSEGFVERWRDLTAKPPPEAGAGGAKITQADYIAHLCAAGMTANGVFGTKIMFDHLAPIATWLGAPLGHTATDFASVFAHYFPNLRFIHLYRRDKLGQAVSLYLAQNTGAWRSGTKTDPAPRPPYDRIKIQHYYDLLNQQDKAWADFLSPLEHVSGSLAYEDLRRDFDGSIRHVFKTINVTPLSFPASDDATTLRQTDPLKDDYTRRFRADTRHH